MRLSTIKQNLRGMLVLVMTLSMFYVTASATKVTVLDGQISVADSQNTGSVNSGTYTATVTGTTMTRKTNNITIVNETTNKAMLTFDYSASTYNSFTVAGATASASGTYSDVLDAGASVTLVLVSNSGFSNKTATLKLSNFSLSAVASSATVTLGIYDTTLGSATVGGGTSGTGNTEEKVSLVAVPNSGTVFAGWIDSEGKIISTSTSYDYYPTADITVRPVFIGSNSKAHFGVGAATQKSVSTGLLGLSKLYYYEAGISYIFDDLNTAASAAAASSTNKVVTLLNSATLPAGDYTIPAGVTLLIPFDDANSLYTTQVVNTGTYTTPTAFRTLTMADGANLIVNGAMSVSAKQAYTEGSHPERGSSPTGDVAFVEMQGSSSITVNNDGALYAYGFITGSGSVTANSGATIYEMFQFMDFRGGTASTKMDDGVFPLSQYYVQNIEVPLTIYAGAREYAYTTMYMTSADFGSAVEFIGSSGMFSLTSGYAVKSYDGTTDRLNIDLYGDAKLSNVKISFGSSGSINSEEYDLPLNHNITVELVTGSATIAQDIALLPGTEVIISEGTTCTIDTGINIYVYDADEWTGKFYHSKNETSTNFVNPPYAPGRTYNRTREKDILVDAKVQVDGTLDVSAGYGYTTASGANVCSTGTGVVNITEGTQTVTYQRVQDKNGSSGVDENVEIPITSAKLKNADGTYVQSVTNTYTYINGFWCCSAFTGTGDTCSICGSPAVAQIGDTKYHTLASAVAADSTGYIQMLADTAEPSITAADKTVYLDLNGKTVTLDNGTGTLTVTKLYGMDSATNAYTALAGKILGSVVGSDGNSAVADYAQYNPEGITGKYYVAHQDTTNNTWSFHRFDLGVDSYTFYTTEARTTGSLEFVAVFKGDSIALEKMAQKGFRLYEGASTSTTYGDQLFSGTVAKGETNPLTEVNETTHTITGTLTGIGAGGLEINTAFSVNAVLKLTGSDEVILGPVYFVEGITFAEEVAE